MQGEMRSVKRNVDSKMLMLVVMLVKRRAGMRVGNGTLVYKGNSKGRGIIMSEHGEWLTDGVDTRKGGRVEENGAQAL